jgi:hypothetical protein
VILKLASGRNFGPRSGWDIVGSLVIFRVAKAVRVHAIVASRLESPISEEHDHFIANFGANYGTQNTKPGWLRFRCGKTGIGVLNVADLRKNVAIGPRLRNLASVNQVLIRGGKIPNHVLGLDVVVPHLLGVGGG